MTRKDSGLDTLSKPPAHAHGPDDRPAPPQSGPASGERSIFQNGWWLDAVTDGRWREIMVGGSTGCRAWLPIYEIRRRGRRRIGMPPLTHTLGPVFVLPTGKPASEMAQRRKLLKSLLSALPPHDEFINILGPHIDDAYAFIMSGFEVSLSYTSQIDAELDATTCWMNMTDKARNVIRKGQAKFAVDHELDISTFVEFYERNLHGRHLVNWSDPAIYLRLHEAARARDAIRLVAMRTPAGALAAACLLVSDAHRMYYLQSTRDPQSSDNTAVPCLVWEAIKLSREARVVFDLDGFPNLGSARFINAFGGRPTPRFTVVARSRKAQLIESAKQLLAAIQPPRRRQSGAPPT
jgi:hypothetical protein